MSNEFDDAASLVADLNKAEALLDLRPNCVNHQRRVLAIVTKLGWFVPRLLEALAERDAEIRRLNGRCSAAPLMLHALQLVKDYGSYGETDDGESVSYYVEEAIAKAGDRAND